MVDNDWTAEIERLREQVAEWKAAWETENAAVKAADKEIERLRARVRELEGEPSLGVGDGTGQMFVHGSYEAIKLLQSKIFELEALRSRLTAAEETLSSLYSFPGVKDLLAPSGSLGSIRDAVEAALSGGRGA